MSDISGTEPVTIVLDHSAPLVGCLDQRIGYPPTLFAHGIRRILGISQSHCSMLIAHPSDWDLFLHALEIAM
jgi:hypothetical protein